MTTHSAKNDAAVACSSYSPATPIRGTAWAELALAVGGFGIGTGEFVSMGLLPEIARNFDISIPTAGHVISAYALGVVVGAPLIAVIAARWSRQRLLIALMVFFALGNFASALAPGYASAIAIRFAAGLPHGAYFGVASLVAASLAPANQRAQAVGRMMLGLTGATLAGVPLATWIGQTLGWRAAFVLVGCIGVLTCVLIARCVPKSRPVEGASGMRELSALGSKQVWLTLGVGSVGFGGMFCVFSYIAPTLTHVAGMHARYVPFVLAVFGTGMVIGNLIGAKLADRALMRTIGGVLIWNIIVLSSFSLAAPYPWLVTIAVLLVGTGVAIVPALQTRLMDVAHESQTLAAALNHSAFNIANALGAWLGGLAIDSGFGWASTGWVGALLAVAGLGIFAVSATQAGTTEARTGAARARAGVAAEAGAD
ncbi:MAG: major facilitator superfamily 1 [Gammaproteobacteria bacterium]|nr:major facilitator superfamily 1 [Gammaproteobacteria bacterium]